MFDRTCLTIRRFHVAVFTAYLSLCFIGSAQAGVVDATKAPWNVVGKLRVEGVQSCSAALVAPNLILTAGHCIYDRANKSFYAPAKLHFFAGLQGNKLLAQSQAKAYTVATKTLPEGEFDENALLSDWAIVELVYPIGCMLGYMKVTAPLEHLPEKLIAVGYPQSDASQLHAEDHCEYALEPKAGSMLRLKNCAVEHGDSGGPLLALVGNKARIVGVLSAGTNDSKGRYRAFAVPSDRFSRSIQKASKSCDALRPSFP